MINILSAFFEWNIQRLANPWVITGLVLMAIGAIVLIFRAKIAYHITLKLKEPNDEKLEKTQLYIMVACLVLVLVGALVAVLFI